MSALDMLRAKGWDCGEGPPRLRFVLSSMVCSVPWGHVEWIECIDYEGEKLVSLQAGKRTFSVRVAKESAATLLDDLDAHRVTCVRVEGTVKAVEMFEEEE